MSLTNEWIHVSEREPTEEDYKRGDGWVIVAFEDGTVRRGYKSHCEKRWFSETPNNKVTYWMPFPLPPKEEK